MPSIRVHGILALATLAVCISIGALANQQFRANIQASQEDATTADIALEHALPAELELSMSTREHQAVVEIALHGKEDMHLTVPSDWERTEVKHVALSDIVSEPAMFGFTRFRIPAGARVTYKVLNAPEHVLLHNPSKQPLKVTYTLVHLDTDEVLHDVVLLNDAAKKLW